MRRRKLIFLLAAAPIGAACSRALGDDHETSASGAWPGPSRPVSRVQAHPPPVGDRLELSDEEWRERLTREQYRVLRRQGTERAFSAGYDEHRDGTFYCAGCGAPLYSSRHKFDSGTGWPSFYQAIEPGRVARTSDRSHGMVRTELHCARCEGHLGHVFDDGPPPTGERHCINSVSLTFVPS